MDKEKLIKIRKREHRGATGILYDGAQKTGDIKLIKEINRILIKRRKITTHRLKP